MRENRYATVADVRRMADFVRARTLAEQGFVAMAREIVERYAPEDRPRIVADVGVCVPRRGRPAGPR